MKTGFQIIDGLTSADVAVRIRASSMEEILKNAGCAMLEILLENPEEFNPATRQNISIEAENEEMLLYRFLDELIFLKDTKHALARLESGIISNVDKKCVFRGLTAFDFIDPNRHRFNVDIKAVTLHGLSCKKEDDEYVAQVVFDV